MQVVLAETLVASLVLSGRVCSAAGLVLVGSVARSIFVCAAGGNLRKSGEFDRRAGRADAANASGTVSAVG